MPIERASQIAHFSLSESLLDSSTSIASAADAPNVLLFALVVGVEFAPDAIDNLGFFDGRPSASVAEDD